MRVNVSGSTEFFKVIDTLAKEYHLSRSACIVMFSNLGIKCCMSMFSAEEFKELAKSYKAVLED